MTATKTSSITIQATKADAQKAMLGMFTCFNLGGNELERKARHDAYWTVLAGLPLGAVIAACRDAAKGNLGDGCFVPTAAMLYQRALTYLPRSTPAKPNGVLEENADCPIPHDEHQRALNGFKALNAALRGIDLTDQLEVPKMSVPVLKDIAATGIAQAKDAKTSPPSHPLREWKSIPLDKLNATQPLLQLSEEALWQR